MDVTDLQQRLDALTEKLPAAYGDRKAAVNDVYDTFRRWAAAVLEKPLWQEIQSRPHDSLEQRRELIHWLNYECRSLGLAVACPNTGKPSLLIASLTGGRRGIGSFSFETVGENGRKTTSGYRSVLPGITLVPDSEERSNWAEYTRRRNRANEGRA